MTDDLETLPRLFATAKLHKDPYGWRFISGARLSSAKPFGVLLHKVLSRFKMHFSNYCQSIHRNSGNQVYWSVSNSVQVVEKLTATNNVKAINCIITCDFSMLFTNVAA